MPVGSSPAWLWAWSPGGGPGHALADVPLQGDVWEGGGRRGPGEGGEEGAGGVCRAVPHRSGEETHAHTHNAHS